MALLPVLEYPDPRLRIRAQAVRVFDPALQQLIADMLETMYAAPAIGLAATQVDVHQRVLVMDASEGRNQPQAYINPEILRRDGAAIAEEACLSVPDTLERVQRAAQVRVRAQDGQGQFFERDLLGLAAVCLQHEVDHLAGKLFVDYLSILKRFRIRRRLQQRLRVAQQFGAPANQGAHGQQRGEQQ